MVRMAGPAQIVRVRPGRVAPVRTQTVNGHNIPATACKGVRDA
jgi:hypothetical protein